MNTREKKLLKAYVSLFSRAARNLGVAIVGEDTQTRGHLLVQYGSGQRRSRWRTLRRAEVRSTQATQKCTNRGFKCIYVATLPDLTARICEWRQAPAPAP